MNMKKRVNGKRKNLLVVTIIVLSTIAMVASAIATGEITATRDISTQIVKPGETFTVTVTITVNQDIYAPILDENPPSGWTVIPIQNDGATFKESEIKWLWMEMLPAGTTKTVTYNITVPTDAEIGTYYITGSISAYQVSPIDVDGETEVCIGIEPPNITSFAPPTPVSDYEGATRTFNITVNQIVNVSWQINGTEVQTNESVTEASYTNTSAKGVWNVSAIATSKNGTAMQTWIWNVTEAPALPVHNINTGEDFETIQAAIYDSNTTDGHTIIVDPGTYYENVDVNKSLTIRSTSENSEDTIVQAANPNDHVFEVTADYVNISEFTVKGATGICKAGICLVGYGVGHCYISDNNASNNDYGIYLSHSNNNMLTNNTANSNNDGGISTWESHLNTISNNTCINNYAGISLRTSNSNTVTNNFCKNNVHWGINVYWGSSSNTISNNDCSGNKAGIRLISSDTQFNTISNNNCSGSIGSFPYGNGISLYNCNFNVVSNNTCANNENCGILLRDNCNSNILINNILSRNIYGIHTTISTYDDNNNNSLIDCNITENDYGIYLYSSDNNTITNNTCTSNNWYGIYLNSSSNNTVYINNFINNTDNVYSSDSTNIWNSTEEITYVYNETSYENYMGNYWDDYTGSDSDKDGIGDTHYSINSDKDNYPLMQRFENYIQPCAEILLLEPTDYIAPHTAISGSGEFVIVYPQDDGAGYLHYNVYAQRYTANGIKIENPLCVNTNYEFNDNYVLDVAMNEKGDFAVVWQNGQEYLGNENVILQVVDNNGNLVGQEIVEPVGGDGTENIEVAIDGNNVVVAWCYCSHGSFKMGRYVIDRDNNNVTKLGATITVYTPGTYLSGGNPIGIDVENNRIITACMDGSGGIYIKGYNFDDGNIYLPQTQIDSASVQRNSMEIQINNAGYIVAAWVPYTGNDTELYVQRINSDGTLNGDKIKINEGSDGYIDDVNLMMPNNGDFVIVWYNNGQDAGVNGIFSRKTSNDVLEEINRLDTLGDFVQYPTADMNINGDYIVAWYTYFQTLTGSGVYGIVPAPPTPTPTQTIVSIEDASAASGSTTDPVPINITDVADLYGADIWLNYNPNVVTVESVSDGDLGAITYIIDNTNGTRMNWDATTGKTGDFVFAYVTLKAVGDPGATSELDLDVRELYDSDFDDITHTIVDGTFAVKSELMEGDTNLDNCVSLKDSTLIKLYLAGGKTLNEDQEKCADTWDDDAVTLKDSTLIKKWLVDPTTPLWESPADDDMLEPVAC